MCRQTTTYQSSTRQYPHTTPMDASIGDLFRDHGEKYISTYRPPLHKIKLIRAVRLCKTPVLGGKVIECKACGHRQVIYLSCGHSQCPLCQNHKRNVWQAKISLKMLKVPYVHTVFTIPHELNRLARHNQRLIYGITLRAAWKTVKDLAADTDNIGGLPGMITVLHTFGSDMKYHIHVHALITFGGVNNNGQWLWPKRRKKIAPFRRMCSAYRKNFIAMLDKALHKGDIIPVCGMPQILQDIAHKRWNVRNGRPTMNTDTIERYLARYINRVAISRSRLTYIKDQDKLRSQVHIIYKDYRRQNKGQAAPKAIKTLEPLVAINMFMNHVLPPYLQKTRHYGLHAYNTWKKYEDKIADNIKRHKDTVRNLFMIIKALLQLEPIACQKCRKHDLSIIPVKKDPHWIFYFITIPSSRAPPSKVTVPYSNS